MKLQTQIPIKKETNNLINYDSKIVLLGSCFSENIGSLFAFYKFRTLQNPFGILFHPKAIEKLITYAINQEKMTASAFVFQNECWHSFDVHSSLSNPNKKELLKHLNTAISTTHIAIQNSSHLIITLGTAWVYRFIESDEIVANCHKIPQKKFAKELLSVHEISEILEAIVVLLATVNPTISIIFTVSPVRHLKDGFVENSRSKAHLIAGIHQVIETSTSTISTHYFPSYEIQMDELRDYRFYAEDLIHPTKTAIHFIWEKFLSAWFTQDTKKIMQEIENIQKGMLHRPFHENSHQHKEFLQHLNSKKAEIEAQFPFIQF